MMSNWPFSVQRSPFSVPADLRRTLQVYNALFPLVFLAMLPGWLARMLKRGGYREGFGQRLGYYSAAERAQFSDGGWTWVHSISVGETLVALRLVRELQRLEPGVRVVLSATTSTGFALAREAEGPALRAVYNPVDFAPAVRRTLDALRPRRLVLIEGEAWPNLLAECRRRGVPLTLANARLSPRSARRFARARAWTGPVWRLLDAVLVSEPEDVERWVGLGVERGRVRVTGNVKYDVGAPREENERGGAEARRVEEFRALLAGVLGAAGDTGVPPVRSADVPPAERPVVMAGSTHAGEEGTLAAMLPAWRQEFPGVLLAIAPRHVERAPEIVRELESSGWRVLRRSSLPAPGAPCDILLLDTTGELRDWYALATVVFIGKSLTATGGQNPAEPAAAGKPVVSGPHLENFEAVAGLLERAGALRREHDAAGVAAAVAELLRDPAARAAMGGRGRAALAVHAGATERQARAVLEVAPSEKW